MSEVKEKDDFRHLIITLMVKYPAWADLEAELKAAGCDYQDTKAAHKIWKEEK